MITEERAPLVVAPKQAPLKVALLGCGTVGAQVYRLLLEQSSGLSARAGERA